ncbi:MAG: hypothetical protein IRZ04_02160 [Rhodospirillales bacterium]|nr:hypothetical protein [Rhodospirillales bacterium]
MLGKVKNLIPALVAAGTLPTGAAHADRIDVAVQLVRHDGTPIAERPVRLVVGSEPESRSRRAGESLTTDAEGRVRRIVDAPVRSRRITLDNAFIPHKVKSIAVGIELDLAGRPVLYWAELDSHREGTLGRLVAYVPGREGNFDAMLQFHPREFVWSFPGEPDGPRLISIGAELRSHAMEGGDGSWRVDLVIEKHEFQMR